MRHLTIIIILIFSIHKSNAQDWRVQMDSVLTVLAKNDMYQGQVLIAEKGKILFSKAYGNKLDASQTPITTSTPLAVKSITKSFTSAAILVLVQQGKIKLDDDVKKHITDWPYDGITIKQLLSMTSGLPDFVDKAVMVADTTKFMTNQDILKLISKHPVKVKKAGYQYDYKNSNYITLAAIIENVSGISYTDFVSQHLFKPLGLLNTYLEDLTLISDAIDGDTFYAPYGDGNLYSTAEDLYTFEQTFYDASILNQNSIDATLKKTQLASGNFNVYGLGWWVNDTAKELEYYIIGDGPNIRSSIQRYPETKSTLIFIHNYTGRYWKDVYWTVYNIWKGKEFNVPEIKSIDSYDINTELLDKFVGKYNLDGFGIIHISKTNNTLYLRPDAVPGKEELFPSSDSTFYFGDKSVEFEFFFNSDGTVKGLGFIGKPEAMGLRM